MVLTNKCSCGWVLNSHAPARIYCRQCGNLVTVGGDCSAPIIGSPKIDESRLAKLLKPLRRPSDRGVGDTVERAISAIGGSVIKRQLEAMGIDCGCDDRKTWLNKKYPY